MRTCGSCGLEMSLNPHPKAGDPQEFVTIGTTWVCIPCTAKSRNDWFKRATALEADANRYRKMRHHLLIVERNGADPDQADHDRFDRAVDETPALEQKP